MASFHVQSEVCIAPFYERIKVGKFALHIDGSNSDFAPHMEGINVELLHTLSNQKILPIKKVL